MLNTASLWRVFIRVKQWLLPSVFLATPQCLWVCVPVGQPRRSFEVEGVIRGGVS